MKDLIKKQFKTEAKKIWGSSVDNLNIKVRIGENINQKKHKQFVPASLEMPKCITPRASGNVLLKTSKNITLQVHPETLKLSKKKLKNVLKHEALHIGYFQHDKEFRRLAEKFGIPITFESDGLIKIKEQCAKGKRFRTVAMAKTEQEARKMGQDLYNKNRSKGYRYMIEW